jgi:nicotinamidase-related amidase
MESAVNCALLVMDVQPDVVDPLPGADLLLNRIVEATTAARKRGILVVFVRVAFRPGYPEINERNRVLHSIAQDATVLVDGSPGAALHPALSVQVGEPIITKKRTSAFAGSELELMLRSRAVTRLVVCGVVTSGVVLSTVREATDRDYELVVLADACADRDDEIHRFLMDRIFPRQADVLSVGAWCRLSRDEPPQPSRT